MSNDQKTVVLSARAFFLVDLQGDKRVRLYDEILFGRNAGNVLFPDDALISKRHFKIKIEESKVFLIDCGSTNKTKVDGKEAAAGQPVLLTPGVIVEFGNQRYRFEDPAAPKIAPSGVQLATPVPKGRDAEPALAAASIASAASAAPASSGASAARDISSPKNPSVKESFQAFIRFRGWGVTTWILALIVAAVGALAVLEVTGIKCEPGLLPVSKNSLVIKNVLLTILLGGGAVFVHYRVIRTFTDSLLLKLVSMAGVSFLLIVAFAVLAVTWHEPDAAVHSCSCILQTDGAKLRVCQAWAAGATKYGVEFGSLPPATQEAIKENIARTPFLKLSDADQDLVLKLYKDANRFARKGQPEATAEALGKIHALLPEGYENSKNLEKLVRAPSGAAQGH